jgi:Holliday junction DNA helicase RuvA
VLVTQEVLRHIPGIGQEMRVYTHFHVRDDAFVLYGFATEDERLLFQQLIGVSGIGPKTALGILSAVTPAEFTRAIHQQQISILTSLPGVGKKTAERLMLELKDKLMDVYAPEPEEDWPIVPGGGLGDAVEALMALGYAAQEAERMVQDAYTRLGDDSDLQALLKLALASSIPQKGDRGWRRNE